MDGAAQGKRLLFVNASVHEPTPRRRTRGKRNNTEVRRHLMLEIGKSRRKPPRAPQYDTHVWSLPSVSEAPTAAIRTTRSCSTQDNNRSQPPATNTLALEESSQPAFTTATPPLLHALSVFEREWGEDSFSAYGFNLIMAAGYNVMASSHSPNNFWVPFALKRSKFLDHYKNIFDLPDVLVSLYRRSARQMRSLALDRSLQTIRCVEKRLSSPHMTIATSEDVIHAILALICYNFISQDFGQAMIHLQGVRTVIVARGGVSSLDSNREMIQMISWVDITTALLHDTIPLFPLPGVWADGSVAYRSGWRTLPTPLLQIVLNDDTHGERLWSVVGCIGDLNTIVALIQVDIANSDSTTWSDEGQAAFPTSRLTHHLLQLRPLSTPSTASDMIAEALRLGALIFIIQVRRKCRSYPSDAQERISTLLKLLSNKTDANDMSIWDSDDSRLIRTWLLVICSICEPNSTDMAISTGMIVSDFSGMEQILWIETLAEVRQMPWLDMFEPPLANLEHRLFQNALGTYSWLIGLRTSPGALVPI